MRHERTGIQLSRIVIVSLSGVAVEIVVVGRDPRRTKGHVSDLRDAKLFSHRTRIFAGEFRDCCSADITILTVGVSQSGSQSRLEGLKETAAILKDLVRNVSRQSPRGILLIASNPVDVMTYAAWKWSGLSAHRVVVQVHLWTLHASGSGSQNGMVWPQIMCMPTSSENTVTVNSPRCRRPRLAVQVSRGSVNSWDCSTTKRRLPKLRMRHARRPPKS
jgi:lactate/malate dehydrogenase, NAD binding domain